MHGLRALGKSSHARSPIEGEPLHDDDLRRTLGLTHFQLPIENGAVAVDGTHIVAVGNRNIRHSRISLRNRPGFW